jgi:hypothetical protein
MAETPTPQHEDDPKYLDRQMVRWTRVVGRFTALLFFANALGLFFIYQQWKVANDAQVDTREQLRAVVQFTGGNLLITTDKDQKPTFQTFVGNFQNYGGTRTAKFYAWDSLHFFPNSVPNSLDFSKRSATRRVG